MSELRFNVVESAFYKKAAAVGVPEGRPCDYFGKYVFGREQMFHYLNAETYASLINVIDNGAELDRKVADEVAEGHEKWFAYMEYASYIDVMRKETVDTFIALTHEKYKEKVGGYFGGVVPAIFTDEPQFTRKRVLDNSWDTDDITMPWTDDIPDTYKAQYGEDIIASLPEIFWELPDGKVSTVRYHYHDHIAERFAQAFADVCGEWCRKNGIRGTMDDMDFGIPVMAYLAGYDKAKKERKKK